MRYHSFVFLFSNETKLEKIKKSGKRQVKEPSTLAGICLTALILLTSLVIRAHKLDNSFLHTEIVENAVHATD